LFLIDKACRYTKVQQVLEHPIDAHCLTGLADLDNFDPLGFEELLQFYVFSATPGIYQHHSPETHRNLGTVHQVE
jgi:hypothetical protein